MKNWNCIWVMQKETWLNGTLGKYKLLSFHHKSSISRFVTEQPLWLQHLPRTHWILLTPFNFQTQRVMTSSTQAYGEPWYWDNRYTNEPGPFDWYQKYLTLAPIINLYVPPTHRILVVGCGNSGTFSSHTPLFLFSFFPLLFRSLSWVHASFFGFNQKIDFYVLKKIFFCGVCSLQRRHGGWWRLHRCCQRWYILSGYWSYEKQIPGLSPIEMYPFCFFDLSVSILHVMESLKSLMVHLSMDNFLHYLSILS